MKQILFNTDMVRAILDNRKTVFYFKERKKRLLPMPKGRCFRRYLFGD